MFLAAPRSAFIHPVPSGDSVAILNVTAWLEKELTASKAKAITESRLCRSNVVVRINFKTLEIIIS
jgi:hypothetical protein